MLVRCLANLHDGADLLLITGRIGMSVLCTFSCALSVGGEGFFWFHSDINQMSHS